MMDNTEAIMFVRSVGYVLRKARQHRDWTLDTVHRRTEMDISVVSRIETGVRALRAGQLAALCSELGVSPSRVVYLAEREALSPPGRPS